MNSSFAPKSQRIEQRAAWLARLERWTAWPLTVLAAALVPILLAPYLLTISDDTRAILFGLDYLIWGIFAADLMVKLAIAPHRLRYLRTHWFDVLLVAIPLLRPLRAARSLRAVRIIQLGWVGAAAGRSLVGIRRAMARRGIQYTAASALVIMIAAGALVTIFERDAPNASIRTISDGLWWSATTVTTVGYGDTYPTTQAGRGVAVALMILGIALFGVLTANLAALLVEGKDDEVLAQLQEINERLKRLEQGPEDRA